MRRIDVHLFWSARSIFRRALVRHHQCKIMTSGKSNDIRIRVKLHDVTTAVEGDPNGSNRATPRWQREVVLAGTS
jgi:hypothetical protein